MNEDSVAGPSNDAESEEKLDHGNSNDLSIISSMKQKSLQAGIGKKETCDESDGLEHFESSEKFERGVKRTERHVGARALQGSKDSGETMATSKDTLDVGDAENVVGAEGTIRSRGTVRRSKSGKRSSSVKPNDPDIREMDDDDDDAPKIRRVRRVTRGAETANRGNVTRIKVRRSKSGDGMDEEITRRLIQDHLASVKKEDVNEGDNSDEPVVRRKIVRSKSTDGPKLAREKCLSREKPSRSRKSEDDEIPAISRHAEENLRRLAGGAIRGADDLSTAASAASTTSPPSRRDPRRGVARTVSKHRPRSMSPNTANRMRASAIDDDESEEHTKTRGGRRPNREGVVHDGGAGESLK